MKFTKVLTICLTLFLCVLLFSCNSSDKKYSEFVKKAEEIEKYSKENYESAVTQQTLNIESYNVYLKWDSLMNEVYEYLGENFSRDEFSTLESQQEDWLLKKEKAVEEAAADWKGGSGEPLARNSTEIKYTKERCYYLISLVK